MGELTDAQRRALDRAAQAIASVREQGQPRPFLPDGSPNPDFAGSPQYERATGGGPAILRGIANGATLTFADNALGAMAAVTGRKPDGSGYGDYSDPGASYAAMRDLARSDLARDAEEQPGASMLGNVIGGAATSAMASPRLVGAGLRETVTRLGRFGAGEGALVSAGSSDADTWGGLIAAAGKGAVVGGVLGATAPAASGAIQAGLDPFIAAFKKMRGTPYEGRAARHLFAVFRRAGMSPEDATRAISEATQEGQGVFTTMDALGRPGARSAAGVARQPGEGGEAIAEHIAQRQLDQGDRVAGFVQDALGANETAAQATRRLTDVRATEADTLWGAARQGADPVDVRPALAAIDQRLAPMQQGGVRLGPFDRRLSGYRDRLSAPNPPPGTNSVDLSDFSRVHEVKRDLADDIAEATRNGRNNEARTLTSISRALDGAMENASEGYRRANDAYAGRSRVIDAIETGQAAANQRGADAVDAFRALPAPQQGPVAPSALPLQDAPQAARIGYADKRLGAIERATTGRDAAAPFRSGRDREIMDAYAYDPARFGRQMDRERVMTETRQTAVGGSHTADRLADQADSNGAEQAIGLVQGAMTGGVGQAGVQAVRRIAAMGMGLNEETRTLIAQVLLSKDPRAAMQQLLRSGARDAGQQRAVEALVRHSGYAIDRRLSE